MQVTNRPFITNQATNTNFTSAPTPLMNMVLYSIQAVFSGGTVNGTAILQVSDDQVNPYNPLSFPPTNWTNYPDSQFTITTTGSTTWNVEGAGYNWVRVVFIDLSGGTATATVNAVINGKGF